MIERPPVKYAKSGDASIAYQVLGDGPIDVVLVLGFISHLDLFWDHPLFVRAAERFASFSRVIMFDKRGVGLSDPVSFAPTLEQRMDDLTAVMDAAGSESAVLFGSSEGGPMSILFASTYPDRTRALVLYGAMARSTYADDYPWAAPKEALLESVESFLGPTWGTGASIEIFSPSTADDPAMREWDARFERQSASPAMVAQLVQMFFDIDVRHALATISAPTLVLHRNGDRVVNIRAARYIADQIPDAKLVELEGVDHSLLAGDIDSVVDEIEEFLTGIRPTREPERVLATVLFTDIVGSTAKAAELGDSAWRQVLGQHQRIVRDQLSRHRGVQVKDTGDGVLATFDGPARAVRCAVAIRDAVESLGLQIRAGLHTGECELLDGDVGGIAVNTASRITDLAVPGEVLVSRTVKDLVAGSGIAFTERGSYELKGVPDRWELLAVTGV